MIELTKNIKEYGLDKVCQKYYLKAKRHKDYPNLVLLKYSQLDSPMSEKIVQQSRGIILDEDNNWSIVCCTFDKFFNYEEGNAANIVWEYAKIYNKLNG